jgi:GNAT superfamily N-acetyltransferase
MNSDTIKVRPAVLADLPSMVAMQVAMARETEKIVLDGALLTAGVRAVLTDEAKGRYYVAELQHESKPVGMLLLTPEWSDWRRGWVHWLQSIYVLPEHRRAGVFKALFRHIAWRIHMDPHAVGLRLYVEQHNASAISAYLQAGMVAGRYVVLEKMKIH